MDEQRPIPPIVQALAQSVKMTPFDWWVHPDHVTIVFVEGAKMTFQIEKTSKTTITKMKPVEPVPAPQAASTPPADEAQSPHGSQPKAKKGKTSHDQRPEIP